MKLNDKNVASFAVCSSPVDKEGYLKKGDLHKDFNRRWFVLKGNLLFYFLKKQDKEPQGVIVLEACSVQVSTHGRYSFEIAFDGQGTRTYILAADNDEDMESWMKAISHASYEYLRSIVNELQRRVDVLTSTSKPSIEATSDMSLLHVGPAKAASVRVPQRSKSEKVPSGSSSVPPSRSSPKVRVKNGILVDIEDEQAPPVPPKQKSMTIHSPSRRAVPTRPSRGFDYPQISERSPAQTHISTQPPTSKPHSSPLVSAVPLSNSIRPLSPPSTLDRTPVLQPSQATSILSPLLNIEEERPPPRPPKTYTNGGLDSILQPTGEHIASSHPPHGTSARQIAAPLDPNKTMFEMHEEFTQAMQTLKNERTAVNSNASVPT